MQALTHAFHLETLERLHRHARPFEDPNSTVHRLLDRVENLENSVREPSPAASTSPDPVTSDQGSSPVRTFVYPADPVNLAFTKLEDARIDGQELTRPKWNSLMAELCQVAIAQHGVQWMMSRKAPRVVPGRSTTGGFHHMKDSKASVQYTDATKAWDYTCSLAQELGVCVEVAFNWRDKPEAAYPGERGIATVGCQD